MTYIAVKGRHLDVKLTLLVALWIVVGVLDGCASHSHAPSPSASFATLPSIAQGGYKVAPYIEAAKELQALGEDGASQRLLALAQSSRSSQFQFVDYEKIAILCRMVFTRRSGGDFKRPELGGPTFLGERGTTGYYRPSLTKWLLEPIELVDGVPFSVVEGYLYQGVFDPDAPELYIRYCMTNCDWSSGHFSTKTKEQNEAALQKLVSSPKWTRRLENWEREFLRRQIE